MEIGKALLLESGRKCCASLMQEDGKLVPGLRGLCSKTLFVKKERKKKAGELGM